MKAPTSNIQAPEKLQIPSAKIFNRQRTRKINLRLLKRITNAMLVELKIENAELGINLAGAKEMAELNWKFLQHQGLTDVITFDHAENVLSASWPQNKSELPAGCRKHVHGELFVCVDEAILQARKFGTSWQSEIVRYIVHGVLHLLGYDDHRIAARKKMKREENRLLRNLSKKISLAQIAGRSKIST